MKYKKTIKVETNLRNTRQDGFNLLTKELGCFLAQQARMYRNIKSIRGQVIKS